MNRITTDNYEAFLLDFMEGTLDEAAVNELKIFVSQHPELEIDLENNDLPKITDEAIEIDFKQQLKKTDTAISSESLFDYVEGNLPQTAREEVEANLLTNKALRLELTLLKKTILSADADEVFKDKTSLYKTNEELVVKDRVLAYFEDQLSAGEKMAFEQDLKVNPDLQKELGLYLKTRLSIDKSVVYPEKEELKKWALSYFEGLLSGKDKTDFESELKTNALLQKELDLYAKTRLQADPLLMYPDKAGLKKEARIIALFNFRNVAAVAAAILLLFGLFVLVNRYADNNTAVKPELAGVTKKETPAAKTLSVNSIAKQPVKRNAETNNGNGVQLAAVKPTLQVKTSSNAPSVKTGVPQHQTNSQVQNVAVKQPEKENTQREEPLIAQEQKLRKPAPDLLEDTATVIETQEKYTVLLAVEDTDDGAIQAPAKDGFWKRAVKLAKGANKLGVKAIDGNETSRQKFSLSFNSFSVEKH